MSVASDLIRGHTDTIILSLLIIGDSYGYKINKDIMRLTGNRFVQGSHALQRFQAAGAGRSHRLLLGRRGCGRTAQILHHHRCGTEAVQGKHFRLGTHKGGSGQSALCAQERGERKWH